MVAMRYPTRITLSNRPVIRNGVIALLVASPLRIAYSQCDTLPAAIPYDLDTAAVFQYNPVNGADCWGWMAPDGSHYAIYGAYDGVAFVNASTLQPSDFVPMSNKTIRDMQTYRNYCYAASDPGDGIVVIDLQFLPDSVHVVTTYSAGGGSCHNLAIDTARGFAYLTNTARTGFRVLDLSNPESPFELPGVTTQEIHDVFARNDTVWVPEGNRHTFSCWDMSDKQNPVLLTRVGIPNAGYVHDAQWSPDGQLLATTEETIGKTVKLWDVQDLANVSLVSEFLGPNNYAHNAHFKDRFLFVSHYDAGLLVYDIGTPECPTLIAEYDTHPASDLPEANGCWGVYPYTGESGLVYASNRDGRLFVFRYDTALVDIHGSPRMGSAPLSVNFSGFMRGESPAWQWTFGDGQGSTDANPNHVYGAGIFDVTLEATSTLGVHAEFEPEYITALAETLSVNDTIITPSTIVALDLSLANHVPIEELVLPIIMSNTVAAKFDSVSALGCRTSYFEQKQTILDQRLLGKYVFRLRADAGGGSAPLPPGNGPVLRIFLTINPGVSNGTIIPVRIEGFSTFAVRLVTTTTDFAPELVPGGATVQSPSAAFTGNPLFGPAPISVSFASQSSSASSWSWQFGDDDSSVSENPVHNYSAGLFDVELNTSSVVGPATFLRSQYVTAHAETLSVRDTFVNVGSTVAWDIDLANHIPITELIIPILLSNVPSQATLDSIVTMGGRLAYFESHSVTYDHQEFGSMAFQLTANAGGGALPLPPGAGSIVRVHLTIKPTAVPGNQIVLYMPTLGPNVLQATTLAGDFTPLFTAGRITLTGTQTCECGCHADPVCDGATDVTDVVSVINVAFRNGVETLDSLCPVESRMDADCSATIDIIDVVKFVDVAFRNAQPATAFCEPCVE